MPEIAIITTGGTIAMVRDPSTGASVPASGMNVHVAEVDGLSAIAKIRHYDFSNVPSPYMTPSMLWNLSRLVNDILKDENIDGVVITHGTDTLEESAYFLDLTVQSDKPVVCTAAMRNINELGTDGPRNVVSSVKVALSPASRGLGTLVCLNDEIHAAKEVTKTYTSNVATFDSPGYGPLGIVDEDKVVYFRRLYYRENYRVRFIEENVALIKTFVGDDGRIIEKLPELGYKGLVIEAFGRGNVPPKVEDALKVLIKDLSFPVVITSRCFKGRVLGIYGYKGGGRSLQDLGVIFAPGLSSQKARIKLMVVMGLTDDLTKIAEYFQHS